MLRIYAPGGANAPVDKGAEEIVPETAVWIELVRPESWELALVQKCFNLTVPDEGGVGLIKMSDGYYEKDGAAYMDLYMIHEGKGGTVSTALLGLMLNKTTLVTLCYRDNAPLHWLHDQAKVAPDIFASSTDVLLALMDQMNTDFAERLEGATQKVDSITDKLFDSDEDDINTFTNKQLAVFLSQIGKVQRRVNKLHQCCLSMVHLMDFLRDSAFMKGKADRLHDIASIGSDASTLVRHGNFLADNLAFLLDANFGMINLQQNVVMKIISIVSLVLMPPTLIAGIYGMNFRFMPELQWPFGYLMALLAMLVAAVVPYWVMKRKGWL